MGEEEEEEEVEEEESEVEEIEEKIQVQPPAKPAVPVNQVNNPPVPGIPPGAPAARKGSLLIQPPDVAKMGDGVDFDHLAKQRQEKDLYELQTLIAVHFEQRKKDDVELDELQNRIEQRKAQRAEQIKVRQQREQERLQREKEERARKEAEEARKKAAIANMSMHYGGYLGRDKQRGGGNRRQTAREEKRKILGERRKPLNIDHLNTEKLREKAKDLHSWMSQLEEEKYDLEVTQVRQKYDISSLRTRVSDFMQKFGGAKTQQKPKQIKTLANVSSRAGAFK